MKVKRVLYSVAWAAAVAGCIVGCGGGSGGGIVAPASPPTCSTAQTSFVAPREPQIGGDPRIIVPESSVDRSTETRLRAHTNHLLLRTALKRAPMPGGLNPAQILNAYSIPSGGGSGAIAIIDAFNDPTVLTDFNVFSSTFGLPMESSSDPAAATNRVFQVVYPATGKPATDPGWAQEISLDTQWSHAIAPGAKIYLVEAASDFPSDLVVAVQAAEKLPGVKQITMSFGERESACQFVQYDPIFQQQGITFFASAGDTPSERDYPAESSSVVCVGGTSLSVSGDGTWLGETVWFTDSKEGTSGGPSAFEPRPPFQLPVARLVGAYRGACDISADADPVSGVSVYDSTPDALGNVNWLIFGGTSLSTPIVAAMANVAGTNRVNSQAQNSAFYAGIGGLNFHDITAGSSGNFKALKGWDFPTGVGTPRGLGGF